MYSGFKVAAVVMALALGAPADAAQIKVDLAMKSYGGNRAYLVAYVVDANGQYVSTLYVAGDREKYLAHMDRWYRMFRRSRGNVDGTTGASMGSTDKVSVTLDVPDSMLNSGMTLRVETAVEGQYYVPDDAAIALDDAHNGQSAAGTTYLETVGISY
jgi:hypothetical protein